MTSNPASAATLETPQTQLQELQSELDGEVASLPGALSSANNNLLVDYLAAIFNEAHASSVQRPDAEAVAAKQLREPQKWDVLDRMLREDASSPAMRAEFAAMDAAAASVAAEIRAIEEGAAEAACSASLAAHSGSGTGLGGEGGTQLVSCNACKRVIMASRFMAHLAHCKPRGMEGPPDGTTATAGPSRSITAASVPVSSAAGGRGPAKKPLGRSKLARSREGTPQLLPSSHELPPRPPRIPTPPPGSLPFSGRAPLPYHATPQHHALHYPAHPSQRPISQTMEAQPLTARSMPPVHQQQQQQLHYASLAAAPSMSDLPEWDAAGGADGQEAGLPQPPKRRRSQLPVRRVRQRLSSPYDVDFPQCRPRTSAVPNPSLLSCQDHRFLAPSDLLSTAAVAAERPLSRLGPAGHHNTMPQAFPHPAPLRAQPDTSLLQQTVARLGQLHGQGAAGEAPTLMHAAVHQSGLAPRRFAAAPAAAPAAAASAAHLPLAAGHPHLQTGPAAPPLPGPAAPLARQHPQHARPVPRAVGVAADRLPHQLPPGGPCRRVGGGGGGGGVRTLGGDGPPGPPPGPPRRLASLSMLHQTLPPLVNKAVEMPRHVGGSYGY